MIRFESPCPEPEQKLAWLRITIALGFICGFVLSWRLWVSSRLFPLVPVSDWLPVVPFPLDFIWFFLLLGLLALIIRAQSRWLILTYLILAGLLSLWDQDRWQAWFYQYLFMLAGLGIYAWKKPAARNNQAALNVCRLIVICTYLWSGFQKLNVNFVRSTWPDVAGSFLRFLPAAFKSPPPVLILLIPLLEISIALGLATLKVRNMAVIFALLTHLFILIVLISSGENMVVWP